MYLGENWAWSLDPLARYTHILHTIVRTHNSCRCVVVFHCLIRRVVLSHSCILVWKKILHSTQITSQRAHWRCLTGCCHGSHPISITHLASDLSSLMRKAHCSSLNLSLCVVLVGAVAKVLYRGGWGQRLCACVHLCVSVVCIMIIQTLTLAWWLVCGDVGR